MSRRLRLAVAAIALCFGLWQLAAGLYIPAKAALAQFLIARVWDQRAAGAMPGKPWPWADTYPVAKLDVPRLGITRYILAGANGRTLAFGPGHHDGSALPGAQGMSLIAGHQDTHMRFLKHLRDGDVLRVTGLDGVRRDYRIADRKIVHKDRGRVALDVPGRHLTLLTCYPFDAIRPGGPMRYAILASAAAGG